MRQLLHAQEYWRVKGLRADVVILNEHPADYLDEVQRQLTRLLAGARWAGWHDKPGGMFLLRADGMPEADRSPARPSRASFCAAISGIWRRSSIGRRPGCRRRRITAGIEPAAAAEAGAVAGAGCRRG